MLWEITETLNSLTVYTDNSTDDYFNETTFRPGTTAYVPDSSGNWHLAVIVEVLSDKVLASWEENERFVLVGP